MGTNRHVVRRDDGWGVREEGNRRDTSHHVFQKYAIEAAREIAIRQKSEVLIHGRDGKIRERNSYGNDPPLPIADFFCADQREVCGQSIHSLIGITLNRWLVRSGC